MLKEFAAKVDKDMSELGCRPSLERIIPKLSFSKKNTCSTNIGEALIDWSASTVARIKKYASKPKKIKNALLVLTDDSLVICTTKKPVTQKTSSNEIPCDCLTVKYVWRLLLLEATRDPAEPLFLSVAPGTAGLLCSLQFADEDSTSEWDQRIANARICRSCDDPIFHDLVSALKGISTQTQVSPSASSDNLLSDSSARWSTSSASSPLLPLPPVLISGEQSESESDFGAVALEASFSEKLEQCLTLRPKSTSFAGCRRSQGMESFDSKRNYL